MLFRSPVKQEKALQDFHHLGLTMAAGLGDGAKATLPLRRDNVGESMAQAVALALAGGLALFLLMVLAMRGSL